MKTLYHFATLIIVLWMIFFTSSCKTMDIPQKDIYFMGMTPFGMMPMMMEKGYLNEEHKGQNWVYIDEVEQEKEKTEEQKTEEEKIEDSI